MQPQIQMYIDSHTHLLDYPSEHLPTVIENAQSAHLTHIIANTTSSLQYKPMIQLYQAYAQNNIRVIPGFGIHPCYVHLEKARSTDDLKEEIRTILELNPQFTIGEIGLDFRKDILQQNPKDQQLKLFQEQINLGLQMNRPITIHCVRAHGEMLKILKKINKSFKGGESSLIMHSYGGSIEITKSLLKLSNLSIYFSLSLRRSTDLCQVIPDDRLLCETDSPCQNNIQLMKEEGAVVNNYALKIGQGEKETNEPANVRFNIHSLSKHYNQQAYGFMERVYKNTVKAFKLIK